MKELDTAVKRVSLWKAPRQDGLTSNFYKFFWEDIKELLFDAFKECIENNGLMPIMKQGLVTLIPNLVKTRDIYRQFTPCDIT